MDEYVKGGGGGYLLERLAVDVAVEPQLDAPDAAQQQHGDQGEHHDEHAVLRVLPRGQVLHRVGARDDRHDDELRPPPPRLLRPRGALAQSLELWTAVPHIGSRTQPPRPRMTCPLHVCCRFCKACGTP